MKLREELNKCFLCEKELSKGDDFVELVYNKWGYDIEMNENGYKKIYKEKICISCYKGLKNERKL